MKISTVLFDLDGTLLPMDQEVFVAAYFKGIAAKLAPAGYEPEKLIKAIWTGTGAMIQNDGKCTNEAAFWSCFTALWGRQALEDLPLFEEYYRTDFQEVRAVCGFAPAANAVIRQLKDAGVRRVLATNPIFPQIATHSRIRWAGLEPEDFAHITTYENSTFCKPNPAYYRQILEVLGLSPEECVMVGNDVGDDMAAQALGMQVFLLTDCLINQDGADLSRWPHGGFRELSDFLACRI